MDKSRKAASEKANMALYSNKISTCNDEAMAAAALASLTYGSFQPEMPVRNSDDKQLETIVTRPSTHGPLLPYDPTLTLVMDPYYTDYSVISESDLAILAQFEDDATLNGALTSCPPTARKLWEQHLNQLKRVLGDLGPARKNSGGVLQPFPGKLMEVLDQPDLEHIVCWMPHGRAFTVNSPHLFVKEVLPRFFKQSKFMSFTRQLNLWGFKRLTRGMDNGAYYHPLFLRGRPLLCMKMKRQKVKVNGTVKMSTNHSEVEPNFYDTSRIRLLAPISDVSKKSWPMLSSCTTPASLNMPSLYPSFGSTSYGLFQGTNTGAHPNRFFQSQPTSNTSTNMMMYSNSMYFSSSGISENSVGHAVQSQSTSCWNQSLPPQHPYIPSLWTNNAPLFYNNTNNVSRIQIAMPGEQSHPFSTSTENLLPSDFLFYPMANRSMQEFSQQRIGYP